jgi:uncharacterized protein (DUF1684 family)
MIHCQMMSHSRGFAWVLLSGFLMAGMGAVGGTEPLPEPPDWTAWKAKRLESVAGTNGWTTLVGLFWLPEGTSTFGSSSSNTFVLLPQLAPANIGSFVRSGTNVEFIAQPGVEVTTNHSRVDRLKLRSDDAGASPTVVMVGQLRFFLIQRGERLGIRAKSPLAPTRVHFQGLDYFPYQPDWRLDGQFEAVPAGTTVQIADVTGAVKAEPVAGAVTFEVGGKPYRLLALDDDETHDLWLIFKDGTSGKTTLGGGRFLHVARPGPDARLTVDFNFAYSPPCTYTPFATCPLPPRENYLTLAVPAGEKKYRGETE